MSDVHAADVFINCPFDGGYRPLFDAAVFAVFDCGFRARCAREVDDSGDVRIHKIYEIIGECRYGLHDLSRTELDTKHRLPRFNMPLELGIFLGAKRFGGAAQGRKRCLVMDVEQYRYQKFISDLAGHDIRSHGNDPRRLITVIRNWLRNASGRKRIPGGEAIWQRYDRFGSDLPTLCRELRLKPASLTFDDYAAIIAVWLRKAT